MLKQRALRPSRRFIAAKPGRPIFVSPVKDAGVLCCPGSPQRLLAVSFIHSRPAMTTLNQRAKQLARPSDSYAAPRKSEFVLTPAEVGSPGRSNETRADRKRLQFYHSQSKLLQHLHKATASRRLDASVCGAAYQRCGQGRWWQTLLKVRELQKECRISLCPIGVSIYLKSLRLCVRGEDGFGAVEGRRQVVVKLGREAWNEHPSQNIISTCAALDLCAAADRASGMPWAEQLVSWSAAQDFPKNAIYYTAIAHVYAVHGCSQKVVDFLTDTTKQWQPSRVTLGTLVNDFAERRDWQAAEHIWNMMVELYGVSPREIQYGARCKTHLLCGRPSFAVDAIERFRANDKITTPPVAKEYMQALLVVYHSCLEGKVRKRLRKFIQNGDTVMEGASNHSKKEWDTLKCVCRRIQSSPASVSLRDALVTWNAQRSAMAEWQDHASGSRYLADHE